ncbi:MAG: hypothetical protein AB7J40_03190 [Candidatus Altimarinota bacterium]
MNPHSFPPPQPITSEVDLPEGFGGRRLVVSDRFSIPGTQQIIDLKRVYSFNGQGCRIDQILHHVDIDPDDRFWGMVAVQFLRTRAQFSYVLSPEFVAHLKPPRKKPFSED